MTDKTKRGLMRLLGVWLLLTLAGAIFENTVGEPLHTIFFIVQVVTGALIFGVCVGVLGYLLIHG